MMKNKTVQLVIAGLVGMVLWAGVSSIFSTVNDGVGVAGGLLAENYLPFVQSNNGYNSAKAITTSDVVTGATIAATGAMTVGSTLTVTGDLTVDTDDLFVDASGDVVSVGSSTPNQTVNLVVEDSTSTSTLSVGSNAELFGGCIEMKSMVATTTFHVIATTTGPMLLQTGPCVGGTIGQ